jgi:hypothetical protein
MNQRNRLFSPRSKLILADCERVLLKNNYLDETLTEDLSQLSIHDAATRASITIDNDGTWLQWTTKP